jgi:hypothetical protein
LWRELREENVKDLRRDTAVKAIVDPLTLDGRKVLRIE